MDPPKIFLVNTTIHVPAALDSYLSQCPRRDDCSIRTLIVGDRKTPSAIEGFVAAMRECGHDIDYWGVERQQMWLRRFPDLDRLLVWNSIQRRNLGYLLAAEQGAEVIISVDDDNFATSDDFFGSHACVGRIETLPCLSSSNEWVNVCDWLNFQPNMPVYPRGFPVSKRHRTAALSEEACTVRIGVNAGLWLDDPDVDAVTRIAAPVMATGVRDGRPYPFALAKGTWCPFNSQNTAFHVGLLPCMYLIVMGADYGPFRLGRYDDIWMSYFAKAIMDHLGDTVKFGTPLVRQQRNEHDLLEDLASELPGMILTESLIDMLVRVELTESNYLSCYFELIGELQSWLHAASLPAASRDVLAQVFRGMEVWAKTCEELELP